MNDPNHQVCWQPTRPDFSIRSVRSITSSNCYHESWYEVISRRPLDADDFKALDSCGLLGMGQAFYVEGEPDTITDSVPPVTVDRRTGKVLPDIPPIGYNGEAITRTTDYTYLRYTVKRICDSGD